MAAKHAAKIQTPHGLRTCYQARVERAGKQPLVARLGGIPLVRKQDAILADQVLKPVPYLRKELVRLLRSFGLARRSEPHNRMPRTRSAGTRRLRWPLTIA
jgi:hypothetical protein